MTGKSEDLQGPRRKVIEFIVLTWNSEAYIEKCAKSVLGIESFDVRLHVIDNGSTDGTVGLIESLVEASGGRMDLVKLEENLGTTVSRNIGIKAVSSDADYICVLDSDTIVNDGAFSTMAGILDGNPSIGVVGPSMESGNGVVQMSGRNLPTARLKLRKAVPFGDVSERAAQDEIPRAPVENGIQQVGYLLGACWLMPKHVVDEVGLLDEKIFYAPEDVDYCIRIRNAGYQVALSKEARIIHEYQRISKKKLVSKANFEHVKGLVYLFRKHGSKLDSQPRELIATGGR